MTRWKAAGIHLCLSLLIIGTTVGSIYLLWFPHGLFRIAGMDSLLLTMLMVDIVAGPALTCLVYKTGKPTLKFDLTVIGVLQAAFLGYALHTIWVSRPVFLVWYIDHLSLVFAHEIDPKDLAAGSSPQMSSLSWFGPRKVAIVLPADSHQRQKIFLTMIKEGTSLDRLPLHYRPYAQAREAILRQAGNVDGALEPAAASTGLPLRSLRVVPIESSRDAAMMLIDANTASPIKTIPRQDAKPVEKDDKQ